MFRGGSGASDGYTYRDTFAAGPDGGYVPVNRYRDLAASVIAEARAGDLVLAPVTLGGQRALRTDIILSPNGCAGLLPRTARLWLSADTGDEAFVRVSPWLFAVRYARGQEHIDVTQRVAATDWPGDPFGAECVAMSSELVSVNGVRGVCGVSPEIPPHVVWRRGHLRYTVSGPLPEDDLLRVAASLRPVGT